MESGFSENHHYSDERRAQLLDLNAHTANFQRAIHNLWVAADGLVYAVRKEHVVDGVAGSLSGNVYLDPGTAGVTAALLFTRQPYGWLVADEYYWEGDRKGRLTDKEHLLAITRKWNIQRLRIDPAGASMRAQANEMGLLPRYAKNDFEPGVQVVNNVLHSGKVKIHEQCGNLLNELYGLVWNVAETKPANGLPDHAADCLRYGCLELFPNERSQILK